MAIQPRRTLVLGGARSGKSTHAERLLANAPDVVYVATGGERLDDDEWVARIAAHRARRPPGWRTVETVDVARVLRTEHGTLLIDCFTLWLAAVMDECNAWDDDAWRGGVPQRGVGERVEDLLDAWQRTVAARVVAISNEVGWGVVPATPAGRRFQDEMGRLNQLVAARSDEVLLVVAGRALRL